MKTPDLRAEKKGKTLRLDIYDQIGPSWLGMIDAKSVSREIANAGEVSKIDVHINSPGGDVWEGLAIFNILKDHAANVRVKVDGVAASSASVIAMAGDVIEIPKNALLMIHNPWSFAMGYSEDMRKQADVLDKHRDAIIETYLTKTSKSKDEVAALMDDETWFSGEEAVEAGFATKTSGEIKVSAAATASAVNDIATKYRRTPTNFLALLASATGKPVVEKPDMKTPEEIAAEATAETAKKLSEQKAESDRLAAEAKANADKAMADERKRAADITAACTLAKRPQLASEFIDKGTSLADVNAALVKVLANDNAPQDDGEGGADKGKDEDAEYKAEYAKDKAVYARAGMSEAEFVAMRRIDDGKDQLKTKNG